MNAHFLEVQQRYNQLSEELAAASLDPFKRQTLQKEHAFLGTLLTAYKEVQDATQALKMLEEQMVHNTDPDMGELFKEEVEIAQSLLKEKQAHLNDLLFPPDPLNDRSVFLEIRAGAGGQEAALFASDLMKMYLNYGLSKRWRTSVVSLSETDLGGFREAIIHIEGKNVFGHLKYESGVHRVQRVPETETSGRVHTSTVTVAVLPEAEEVELSIAPQDLRIDVFRAGGAGGQHVNKTESAVRVTHIPTGIVVSCQDDRSQHKNKATALKILKSRILAAQAEQHAAEMSKKRKEQVGSGMRAEKVRTYNYSQNRVTDHQVDLTLKKLDRVMEGDLDEIIQALMDKERELRRSEPVSFSGK